MEILKTQRAAIDALDDQIVDLLATRFGIVRDVGAIKKRDNIPVVQSNRAEQVKDRVAARAASKGLDGALLRAIYSLIIDHAHVVEDDIQKD